MVRKNAAAEAKHVASSMGAAADSPSQVSAGRSSKSKRSKKSSSNGSSDIKNCLLVAVAVLATIVVVGFLGMKSYRPPQVEKYTPNKLRKKSQIRRMQGGKQEEYEDAKIPQAAADFLPPNSVYATKMADIHGDMIDLSQYSGGVSLVVNVACL